MFLAESALIGIGLIIFDVVLFWQLSILYLILNGDMSLKYRLFYKEKITAIIMLFISTIWAYFDYSKNINFSLFLCLCFLMYYIYICFKGIYKKD
jgi:hypothetical protein